ncbi:AraC family transcriptional regulator [Mycobacterium sp. PS03-16]|uniref:AraC family transcriptional regulator n=1 Tax=Mycobacterium sp. PS03-16 TaxID=2559611 RepID=UPI001073D063|nr:helix-turn-helix domain-containing protein [Mycobacterium sp. PS03-16]TFV57501.1 AraC family transcriptional regulator [Mycobacterium sp. PS03-16]
MDAWKNPPTTPVRGVVGRATSGSAFDLQRWAPSQATAEFVDHFWSVTWDLRGGAPVDTTVITFPVMHLTHEWGGDSERHGHRLPATLIHGVVERVFGVTIRDRGAVVGARFRPGGFAARFDRDAARHTGTVVAADPDLFPAPLRLPEDVAAASAALDAAIAATAPPVDPTYRSVTELVDRIRDDDRLQRVDQVVAAAPWSERTTQRVFRRYVGVPVKWVLCRFRLQQAALEIESRPAVDLADLATRLGWYDQAHFSNDFRAMLGCTPGEYASRHGA